MIRRRVAKQDYPRSPELSGERYGLLTVVSRVHKKNGRTAYLCICDCGKEKLIMRQTLKAGHARSCGCMKRKWITDKNTTHGHSSRIKGVSRTYITWDSMRQRCHNPKDDGYYLYGARGIKVCTRWLNSFENFLADMGDRPTNKTIDRINTNGDYEPNNCVWATAKEQQHNRRDNKCL